MFFDELLPTFTLPKAMLVGLGFSKVVAARPVPVRFTDCGEFGALLVKETLPDELPVAVGANFAMNEVV
jgi:hypothetical protein